MKLISLTEFVKNNPETSKIDTEEFDYYYNEWNILNKIRSYADFLSTPLCFSMFIPCDLNGNILQEPRNYMEDFEDQYNSVDIDSHVQAWYNDCKRYYEAKNRVKFKVSLVQKISDHLYEIWDEGKHLFTYNRSGDYFLITGSNIECLVKYNLELTKSVIKNLGL